MKGLAPELAVQTHPGCSCKEQTFLFCSKSFPTSLPCCVKGHFFVSHCKRKNQFCSFIEKKKKKKIDKTWYLKGKQFSISRSKLTANHVAQTIVFAQTSYWCEETKGKRRSWAIKRLLEPHPAGTGPSQAEWPGLLPLQARSKRGLIWGFRSL